MMDWRDVRKLDTEKLEHLMNTVREEYERRESIMNKVKAINSLMAELIGDLTDIDRVDFINNKNGEVILSDFHDDWWGDGWASPEIVLTFNGRSTKET